MGRSWRFRPLGTQECYVSSPVLRQLGIRPQRGDRVGLTIPITVRYHLSVALACV
jgi:hypothetical protein